MTEAPVISYSINPDTEALIQEEDRDKEENLDPEVRKVENAMRKYREIIEEEKIAEQISRQIG